MEFIVWVETRLAGKRLEIQEVALRRRFQHGGPAIFSQRTSDLRQLENPVSHQRKPNSPKPRNTTVPNGSKLACGVFANG